MDQEKLKAVAMNPYAWLSVPIISFSMIGLSVGVNILAIGTAGCVLGSIVLAGIAYFKPRRDIVSLLTPMYAVIIFFGLELPANIVMQILFAASISILGLRLEKRFSTPTRRRK